jgi:hypothetical protein
MTLPEQGVLGGRDGGRVGRCPWGGDGLRVRIYEVYGLDNINDVLCVIKELKSLETLGRPCPLVSIGPMYERGGTPRKVGVGYK